MPVDFMVVILYIATKHSDAIWQYRFDSTVILFLHIQGGTLDILECCCSSSKGTGQGQWYTEKRGGGEGQAEHQNWQPNRGRRATRRRRGTRYRS